MARQVGAFQSQLKTILKAAHKAASQAAMDPSTVSSGDSMEDAIKKFADKQAEVFSANLAPTLAKVIDEYITSQSFNVSGLSAPNGPVNGIIKSL